VHSPCGIRSAQGAQNGPCVSQSRRDASDAHAPLEASPPPGAARDGRGTPQRRAKRCDTHQVDHARGSGTGGKKSWPAPRRASGSGVRPRLRRAAGPGQVPWPACHAPPLPPKDRGSMPRLARCGGGGPRQRRRPRMRGGGGGPPGGAAQATTGLTPVWRGGGRRGALRRSLPSLTGGRCCRRLGCPPTGEAGSRAHAGPQPGVRIARIGGAVGGTLLGGRGGRGGVAMASRGPCRARWTWAVVAT
jgi:hypothetical protein